MKLNAVFINITTIHHMSKCNFTKWLYHDISLARNMCVSHHVSLIWPELCKHLLWINVKKISSDEIKFEINIKIPKWTCKKSSKRNVCKMYFLFQKIALLNIFYIHNISEEFFLQIYRIGLQSWERNSEVLTCYINFI